MTTPAALPPLALSRRVFVVALGGAMGGLALGLRLSPAEAQGLPPAPSRPSTSSRSERTAS